jgi:hypothetical protein
LSCNPPFKITNPKAGSNVNGTLTISATVTGTVGASNTFTFQADNTVLKTLTVNGTSASTSWNTKQTKPGKHTLTVTVTDSNITDPAGNTGTASEQVTGEVKRQTNFKKYQRSRLKMLKASGAALVIATIALVR